jgi:hypothetical protein
MILQIRRVKRMGKMNEMMGATIERSQMISVMSEVCEEVETLLDEYRHTKIKA